MPCPACHIVTGARRRSSTAGGARRKRMEGAHRARWPEVLPQQGHQREPLDHARRDEGCPGAAHWGAGAHVGLRGGLGARGCCQAGCRGPGGEAGGRQRRSHPSLAAGKCPGRAVQPPWRWCALRTWCLLTPPCLSQPRRVLLIMRPPAWSGRPVAGSRGSLPCPAAIHLGRLLATLTAAPCRLVPRSSLPVGLGHLTPSSLPRSRRAPSSPLRHTHIHMCPTPAPACRRGQLPTTPRLPRPRTPSSSCCWMLGCPAA